MLASHIYRLSRQRPVRYAQSVPHPLSLASRYLLAARGVLGRARDDAATAGHALSPLHPLFEAVAHGQHQPFEQLLQTLLSGGHLASHADRLTLWLEQYRRFAAGLQDPASHLTEAFTPGHFIDQHANDTVQEYLGGDPAALIHPMLARTVGADVATRLHLPLVQAGSSGGLEDLLDAHEFLHGHLHGHGVHPGLIQIFGGPLSRAMDVGAASRIEGARRWASLLRQGQEGVDYRPQEMLPEDYYALG